MSDADIDRLLTATAEQHDVTPGLAGVIAARAFELEGSGRPVAPWFEWLRWHPLQSAVCAALPLALGFALGIWLPPDETVEAGWQDVPLLAFEDLGEEAGDER